MRGIMRVSIVTSINDKNSENIAPGTIVSLEREPSNEIGRAHV